MVFSTMAAVFFQCILLLLRAASAAAGEGSGSAGTLVLLPRAGEGRRRPPGSDSQQDPALDAPIEPSEEPDSLPLSSPRRLSLAPWAPRGTQDGLCGGSAVWRDPPHPHQYLGTDF